MDRRRHSRRLWTVLASGLLLAACGTGGASGSLSVMSRNLYEGADLTPVIEAAVYGELPDVLEAGRGVWLGVLATDFATRAQALAAEVDDADPDLLALQEVTLWRGQDPADSIGPSPTPATEVWLDFLQVFLAALESRGLRYDVVSVLETTDAELPIWDADRANVMDLRFTDRDALLVRHSAARGGLDVKHVETGLFTEAPLGGGIVARDGWISADVKLLGETVRVVTTHLSVFHDVQAMQAAELVAGPLSGPRRLILVGDLNSDALHGPGPDDTPTYDDLLAFGLEDAWADVRPGDPGETWGHDAALVDPDSSLWERIDFVLYRGGLQPIRAALYGTDPSEMIEGLWPSDHAGLVVEVILD